MKDGNSMKRMMLLLDMGNLDVSREDFCREFTAIVAAKP
jgi:hypothetical protein